MCIQAYAIRFGKPVNKGARYFVRIALCLALCPVAEHISLTFQRKTYFPPVSNSLNHFRSKARVW